jgi:hypothetical protein
MFLKIMGALPGYLYAQTENELYVNLYAGSRAQVTLGGTKVSVRQTTSYPWDGDVKLVIEPKQATEFGLHLRLPAWCAEQTLKVNGNVQTIGEHVRGYARIQRKWKVGDVVELSLPMPVQRVKANPKIEADLGRVALQRGPLVYCLEAADNGGHVRNLVIPPTGEIREVRRKNFLGDIVALEGMALAVNRAAWPDAPYVPAHSVPGVSNVSFTAIPYYANANRDPGEMRVWMPETTALAEPVSPPTIASQANPSASHCWQSDSIAALNDQLVPSASDDKSMPRFTWWDHRGTKEYVEYSFTKPTRVSAVEVYWWDERRINAHCRVPQSWSLSYKVGDQWKTVPGIAAFPTDMDKFNRVTFPAIETKAIRIDAQLQPDWSGGILEWRVE